MNPARYDPPWGSLPLVATSRGQASPSLLPTACTGLPEPPATVGEQIIWPDDVPEPYRIRANEPHHTRSLAGCDPMPRDSREGRPWRRRRAQLIERGGDCAICGYPVDTTLSGTYTWAPSYHHTTPLSCGGSLLGEDNGEIAHVGCNAAVRDAAPGTPRYVRSVLRRREAYARVHRAGAGVRVGTPTPTTPSASDSGQEHIASREW